MSIFWKLFLSSRPWSFTTSVGGVLLSTVLSHKDCSVSWVYFVLTVLGAVSIHTFANLTNTYFDFIYKHDTPEDSNDVTLVKNILRPKDVLLFLRVTFVVSAMIGGYFLVVLEDVWVLFGIALVGAFLAFQYTAKPLRFKSRGLGDVVIFLCFGPLLMLGASFIQCNRLSWKSLLYSLPWGLLTEAILHANNTRDVVADKRAGANTVAMQIGFDNNLKLYQFLMIFPFIFSIMLSWLEGSLFILLPLLCFPLVPPLLSQFSAKNWNMICEQTAQVGFVYGLLLIVGIYIS